VPNPAISDRISAIICRDTATFGDLEGHIAASLTTFPTINGNFFGYCAPAPSPTEYKNDVLYTQFRVATW
jgi:hypothetical protein